MSFLERRAWKIAAVLGAALAFGACAKNPAEDPSALAAAGAGAGGYGAGGRGPAVPGSPQDFAQNVGDRVFFESDSSELSANAQATLDKQARWLRQYGKLTFTIEGHADERGTREYNFALGARRAEAAKNYLVARGVPASGIHTISYGKERPVAVCNDISCWSQNRRAVTVLAGSQS
ncbi:peptidoglycan-associated lipoprotein Pal [Methylocella sp.]|uniref:peptidoglycan-associated lipoprotein Pal n=1 Tax=Methylocella sp. TaxID=1978226 RepID=UPI003783E686